MLGIAAMFSVMGLFLSYIYFSLVSYPMSGVWTFVLTRSLSVLVSIHLLLCGPFSSVILHLTGSQSLFLSAFSPLRFSLLYFFHNFSLLYLLQFCSSFCSHEYEPFPHLSINCLCFYPVLIPCFLCGSMLIYQIYFYKGLFWPPRQLCVQWDLPLVALSLDSPSLPLCNSVVWDPWCYSWVLQQWVYTAWVWFCRHQ